MPGRRIVESADASVPADRLGEPADRRGEYRESCHPSLRGRHAETLETRRLDVRVRPLHENHEIVMSERPGGGNRAVDPETPTAVIEGSGVLRIHIPTTHEYPVKILSRRKQLREPTLILDRAQGADGQKDERRPVPDAVGDACHGVGSCGARYRRGSIDRGRDNHYGRNGGPPFYPVPHVSARNDRKRPPVEGTPFGTRRPIAPLHLARNGVYDPTESYTDANQVPLQLLAWEVETVEEEKINVLEHTEQRSVF
jgi:hypothetical protein